MGIKKVILNICLSIEAFFLQFLKIQSNRITFISLEHDHPILDFKMIYESLDKEKYDVNLCLIKYKKNIFGQFNYFLNCFKQLYYVYTSKLIILNDNNYVVSNFKREGTTVLQVWHACGAIKKFGNAIQREYKIQNYDYVLSTSKYWKKAYSEAFDVKEENVLPIGMPRTDKLFDSNKIKNDKEYLLSKYPILKDKKILLYAPTFRGNIYKGFSRVSIDVEKILDHFDENTILIYKFHPLLGNIHLSDNERVINMNNESTYRLFHISDMLISDYSSIIFDYMILDKPILFYVPDLKEYEEDLGVYVDIRKLEYPICLNEEQLIENIKNYPTSDKVHERNKHLFIEIQDGKSCERVKEFIESIL